MSRIQDLDILLPEDEVVKFKAGDREYTIKMIIPAAVGFLIIDNMDSIMEAFPNGMGARPKLNKSTLTLAMKIIIAVCHEQYPEIDVTWVNKNLSLLRQGFILWRMINPIYEFLTNSGFLEAVTPVKTPE